MRQTYIVALLSAVVLADDWLTNPTTDEVKAHLDYDWTVLVPVEERDREYKRMASYNDVNHFASVDSL